MQLIKTNEATAAERIMVFPLVVDATDGITVETGESAGQSQYSIDGGQNWTNTNGTLVGGTNGAYQAQLTQAEVNQTAGVTILGRYKSANTAEARAVPIQIVAFDPADATSLGLSYLDTELSDLESRITATVSSLRAHHSQQGNIYFVDPTNGDTHANGNRGGPDDPYAGIQDCHDNAVTDSNHDVIWLVAGASGLTTLTETLAISKRYVFIRGPGRDFRITRSGAGDTITITADGVELSGVRVETAATGAGNAVTVSGVDFASIHDCWFTAVRADAIELSAANYCVVEHNNITVSGQGGSAVGIQINASAGNSSFNQILRNVVQHCTGDGIELTDAGGGNTVEHTRVEGNVVQHCTVTGIDVSGANVTETVLYQNFSRFNTGAQFADTGTNTVEENNEQWAKHSITTEARLAELDAANLPSDVDAILADTGTDGVAIADGYLTAAKFASDFLTAAKIATDAITSDALAASATSEIADAIAAVDLDGGTVDYFDIAHNSPKLGALVAAMAMVMAHQMTAPSATSKAFKRPAGASGVSQTHASDYTTRTALTQT